MRRAWLTTMALAMALQMAGATTAPEASGNLLVDGGFETTVPGIGRPTSLGSWVGDITSARSAENGIVPFEGRQMLRFEWADTVAEASEFEASQLFQLAGVSAGRNVEATARFNRVAGDTETDTLFQLILDFHAGDPSAFPTVANDPLERAVIDLSSDADPSTWELVALSALAPTGSTYVALQVNAIENIRNDTEGIEFAGHYADGVTLIPEPSTALLLGFGLAGLSRGRGRG